MRSIAILSLLASACIRVNPDYCAGLCSDDNPVTVDLGGLFDLSRSSRPLPFGSEDLAGGDPAVHGDLGLHGGGDLGVYGGGDLAQPIAGTTPTAGLCGSSANTCIGGDLCVTSQRLDGSPIANLCRQVCSTDLDCTQPIYPSGMRPSCSLTLNSMQICSFSCDPVGAADGTQGCPRGLSCNINFDSSTGLTVEFTDCVAYGTGGDGASCDANGLEDCRPGFTCVALSTGGAAICHTICRIGHDEDCPSGVCNEPPGTLIKSFGACF